MVKSIITRTPHHRDHHKDNKGLPANTPWEKGNQNPHVDSASKQRLQKHFPERSWHISSELKKGPKI